VRGELAATVGLAAPGEAPSPGALVARFRAGGPERLPADPTVLEAT
jgi:hypothetical protein